MIKRSKLLHVCGWPSCNQVTHGRYCTKHQAMQDEKWQKHKLDYRKSKLARAINSQRQRAYDLTTRDQEAKAFYNSKQWKQVREYVYSRDGARCQVCGNVVTDRKIADHIHPLKYSPAEKLDTSNLWLLCYKCHTRKTKLEEVIAAQPKGITKLQHLDRDWWTRVLTQKQGQTITAKEWRQQHEQD